MFEKSKQGKKTETKFKKKFPSPWEKLKGLR